MKYLLYLSVIAMMFLSIVSCGGSSGGQGGGDGGYTTVSISFGHSNSSSAGLSAQQVPPAVSYIRIYITGPRMAPMEIITSNDSVSIEVPNGSDRHFEIFAYDVNDVLLYYGDTYADLDGTPVTLNIYMSPVQPDISVSPASNDFGNVDADAGDTSAPQTFTVSNTGFMADLDIGTITLTGTDASEFAIQNDTCSGQSIAPAGSCTLDAVFSPASVGAKSANLSIPSNDPDTPTLDVPLSGTGTGICDLYVDVNTGFDTGDCSNILSSCQTITYALTQTPGSESICAAAGTYDSTAGETFPLQLKSGTSLICQGAGFTTVIDAGGTGAAGILGAAGASVQGCEILGADPGIDDNGAAITVDNTNVDGSASSIGLCIGIRARADSTITNSTVSGWGWDLCDGGYGIYVDSGANPTISGSNFIVNNFYGIFVTDSSPAISGNTISSNATGIYTGTADPTVSGNTITSNGSAVAIGNGSPAVTGNTITGNWSGVSVSNGTPAVNNNILSCNTAVDLFNWLTATAPPVDAQNNRWDHVPPSPIIDGTCSNAGEDICNFNFGSVDYTGASLAPSPCTTAGDSWTAATTTTGAPLARYRHTAVWTGAEMVVWGGNDAGGYTNTGGRYNPSTDSWIPTSTAGAPSARYGHPAVWTGTEMVVWGGRDTSSYFNTGGRYNPSTDTWTATSLTGAPTGRSGHPAIWTGTGTEMVVWGGRDTGGRTNTGGRYDPSADTWTATSLTGAPAAREFHTAVWTGAEMIVWGGNDAGGRTNTGGRYDPSTDTWTPTFLTGAPSARFAYTTVWTGTEMIVWGGRDGNFNFLNTGGRYDPSTDTWTATSLTGAPAARQDHTAVWTSAEMVVWGGWDGGVNYLNTGGRYDPSTDTWTATSLTGAPAAREYHTAVWTSAEMIVWGGVGPGRLNTGGRYTP